MGKSNYIPKSRIQDVVVIRILDAHAKMFLSLTNQFTTRITLKGVNYRTKIAKKEIVVDQKSFTQIRKRYTTFQTQTSHKNKTKTKKRKWRYTIFASLLLNQLLENI